MVRNTTKMLLSEDIIHTVIHRQQDTDRETIIVIILTCGNHMGYFSLTVFKGNLNITLLNNVS